jgi:hypothetical protein
MAQKFNSLRARDLDELLHPAQAFEHPTEVVSDPDLTLNEKRAILASWASDACALESMPGLRQPLGSKAPVSFDEVIEALHALDAQQGDALRHARALRRERLRSRRRDDDAGSGHTLC